jgi:hypothetical protein
LINFGGVAGFNLGTTSATAFQCFGTTLILRVTSTTQKWIHGRSNDNAAAMAEKFDGTLNLAVTQTLNLQVVSSGTGNSVHHGSILEYLPAP